MAESSTITRDPNDAPQDQGEKALWYMEIAGPDDMHAVPDFWTGLAWAAELNAFVAARAAKGKWAADDNWPLTQATIRRWTWSAEQHATMLARELSERQEHAEKRAAAIADLERENRELRAYLKAFCAATIDPEDRGRDVSAHEANPFITYQFLYVEEGDPQADRTITGGQVRRAMELVGFDKLKIQPSERTIADELTEARDLRHAVKGLSASVPVPASGTEKRLFWLEAAEQHGFQEACDGSLYTADPDEVLKLMAAAREQGRKDVLDTLAMGGTR